MKINLCGRAKCCPTLEKVDDGYEIKDDYGGKVKLTRENLEKLQKAKI